MLRTFILRGRGLGAGFVVAMAAACGSHHPGDDSGGQGAERQACYPNQTCNEGLTCLSNTCVKLPAEAGPMTIADGGGSFMGEATAPTIDAQPPTIDARSPMDAMTQVTTMEGSFTKVALADSGIQASWLTYNDCLVDPGSCTVGGDEPPRDYDGQPYCTKGTTPIFDGLNFGAGVLLGFGAATDGTIDASALGIAGFSFDLTGKAPPTVQVDLQSTPPSQTTLAVGSYGDAPLGTRAVVVLDNLITPNYALPLDRRKLTFIAVAVLAVAAPVPFDYCIANVALLKK